jgi:DNA replication and repair protein RecF
VRRLLIENLRILAQVELCPVAGVNWLVGANGSGKTSVLEALSLLASGRSFRGGGVDACVRRGTDRLTLFAEVEGARGGSHRLGLQREGKAFSARIDGAAVPVLSGLFAACPAVCVQPDAAELVLGPGELRRRFLDWGLFHVEQEFMPAWRRFNRALRQRNQLLRQRRASAEEAAWRLELARTGEELHRLRLTYVEGLQDPLSVLCTWLLPAAGEPKLHYRPGWPAGEESLEAALSRNLTTDLRFGYTSLGPQRAGWALSFPTLPQRELFSRGQAKLAALAMVLAQISGFVAGRGEAPIVALDDVLAELDPENQGRLLAYLGSLDAQVLLTTADRGLLERHAPPATSVFHVEQGRIDQGV